MAYIIIALVISGILFFLITRYSQTVISKIVPDSWQKEFTDALNIISQMVRILAITIIIAVLLFFIASRFGIDIQPAINAVTEWLGEHGIIILVIILLAYLLNKLSSLTIPIFINRFMKIRGKSKKEKTEVEKRASTLRGFTTNAIMILIILLALFMILSEIGIDIGPLLAGAGVAGIAIGFGAQKLISDIVNGLFIILEDYYAKGDVIKVANISGAVEDINIRRTILRDLDGVVHIVPNSEISVASNFTKNWARVNLNVSISYRDDINKATEVINSVCSKLAAEKYYRPMIISPPQTIRVDKLGDSGIEIKVMGDVKPMTQWEITGELRKRIKIAFDEAGIDIPWPHTKVFFGNKPPPYPEVSHQQETKGKTTNEKMRKRKKTILPSESDID